MHSLPNRGESRSIDQVYSTGCFPGSPAVRRSVRSIVKGWIASAGFDA